MRFAKKTTILILSFVCLMCMAACNQKEEVDATKVVYEYGRKPVTFAEYYIYAKTVQEDYQETYGSGIWSLEVTTDEGKSRLDKVTVQDIIYNINRVKVLVAQAEDMDISLSDKQREEMKSVADTFYAGLTEKDIEKTEITPEIVCQVIEENMLAEEVYNQALAEHEFEISEEEARMTTFCDMVFECYSVKEDGSVEEYTDEKKAAQLEKANEALATLATDEEMTYETIVDKYDLEYAATYTMSRTELIEEYGESTTSKILSLADGEVSVVIESEYGYHIFKMLQAKDEELTKKNKDEIILQMQREYFNGVFEKWSEKYDSRFNYQEDVDMELANMFPFSDV